MSMDRYVRARRLGLKEYHARMQRRESPYLSVLDEVDEQVNALARRNLGLVQVPLGKIVGTASKGRTNAFAANYMPLLDPGSEFSMKWSGLVDSIVTDGMRQPVKALEYMNLFYVIEGNKRVSVMKYLNAVSIEAEVTRVLPQRTGTLQNRIYFEYLDFYRDTQINYLWFTKPGSFAQLYTLTGTKPGEKWSSEARTDFEAAYMRFRAAYKAHNGDKLPITTGDAFLIYLRACGYADAPRKFDRQIRDEVSALWTEFAKGERQDGVTLIMQSEDMKKGGSLLNSLFGPTRVKVGFLYDRDPMDSGWIYWHDLGRISLENALGDKVETTVRICGDPESCEAEIEKLIGEDHSLIFTTSPLMLAASMKASVNYPEARVLNCSLLAS